MKRILHGIIPALLLSVSVGQIYAFTLFSTPVAESIQSSQQAVQFAFSLGIFFLGMGAAFFGRIVENRVKIASIIGTVLFLSGLGVSQLGVNNDSLWLIYLGYGLLLGLGTGTVYITPVKTLMMWFPNHKAVAAALPIIGFGLGSSVCTLLFDYFTKTVSPDKMFGVLACFYTIPMLAGCSLLRKPVQSVKAVTTNKSVVSYIKLMKDSYFWRCWFFMLINISAGLCLIPLAKQMMTSVGYSAGIISTILVIMGLMNGAGRLVFAYGSDFLKQRINILLIIIGLSLLVSVTGCIPVAIGIALIVIPACYGAGFSTIPSIVHDHYGMDNVSTIHGAVLSAWGVAGLIGNQMAMLMMNWYGMFGVIGLIIAMHCINFFNVIKLKKCG